MPSQEYELNRYHAHAKWYKIHRFITGISAVTVVGLLWAWMTAIKAYQHYQKAQQHKQRA